MVIMDPKSDTIKKETPTKTTVSFPKNVLKAMRTYMAREGMGLHDQSKLVALALIEYLTKRGITVEPEEGNLIFEVETKAE